jgi:hypothetical protein
MKLVARFGLLVLVGLSAGVAYAAQQQLPTKILLVKNPPSGPNSRKIAYKVVEQASLATLVGDPTLNGAKLGISLTPGGVQCFDMPAAGWSPISTIGFKYADPTLANSAVKVAQIKKTPSGVFKVKAILKGSGAGGITVVPGNPSTGYATIFRLVLGDDYCSALGTATPNPNSDKTFKISNDSVAPGCSAACSPSGAFLDDAAL